MVFEYGRRVVQAHGNNGAAGLFRNLKRAAVKGQHTQFLSGVAGAFREDTDGNAVFQREYADQGKG